MINKQNGKTQGNIRRRKKLISLKIRSANRFGKKPALTAPKHPRNAFRPDSGFLDAAQLKVLKSWRKTEDLLSVAQFRNCTTLSFALSFSMPYNEQFTYGVVREGVIAENFPQISAKLPQTFRRLSAPFPYAINFLFCKFPRTFRRISANFPQKPFANAPHK